MDEIPCLRKEPRDRNGQAANFVARWRGPRRAELGGDA
jgi:hypothetical protein